MKKILQIIRLRLHYLLSVIVTNVFKSTLKCYHKKTRRRTLFLFTLQTHSIFSVLVVPKPWLTLSLTSSLSVHTTRPNLSLLIFLLRSSSRPNPLQPFQF